MRVLCPLVAALLLAAALPAAAQPAATAALAGTVTDADGRPIPNVNVYIARSQRGTATDAEGRYRLGSVPLGAHRLVASGVGYETATEDLVLRRVGETRTVDFRLAEAEFELGEVTVESTEDAEWQRRYERFRQRFIGETANAAETEILNPYVLDFEERRGTLTATAAEPLVIENRALGYRVRYALTDFEARRDYNFFHGEPLFEEMAPADPVEAVKWRENRERAYRGSSRHLLRSLLAGTAEAEGFMLYLVPNRGPGGFGGRSGLGGSRYPVEPGDLLKPAREEGDHRLTFHGVLEVVYAREEEEDAIRQWEWNRERRAPQPVQTSQLRFPIAEDGAFLDRFGEELDPRSITLSGYMAFERFADELPREYGLAESGLPGAAEAVRASAEGAAEDAVPAPPGDEQ